MEMKIGYCVERIEQYGHREACWGLHTCTKCGEKDLDHMEEVCLKEIRCVDCWQNHSAYARSCKAYKKERDTPGSKENSWYLHGQIQWIKIRYRALMEKLIQLKLNNWLKFQEQLKNPHSAELQTQPRPTSANKEKASETTKVKSPTNKQTLLLNPKRKSPAKLDTESQSNHHYLN